MPAVADLKRHAAALLPLPVDRRSDDVPVAHNHRGETNEFLLLAKVVDQLRERNGRLVAQVG